MAGVRRGATRSGSFLLAVSLAHWDPPAGTARWGESPPKTAFTVNFGKGILAGDVLVDRRDYEHRHDLQITKVEGGDAYYEGSPPQGLGVQSFELVRPLCEPHDIYALGALYYYLLTENYGQVASLRGLVEGLEKKPCALTAGALRERDLYPSLRAAIREKHWQDEMMILILRAMTRGLPESFAQRRIDRGPELAQRFLRAAKQLHYRMQEDPRAPAPGVTRA